MNEKTERPFGENTLSAEELLRNKGIRFTAWDEWEHSRRVLPKTGLKQFEPNGSTLQNMQLEKGMRNRSDLLDIERVERSSQLAMAEWLPNQKKARVTKKSGQDWVNFGTEINATLYLIPEEALILLEMNCLELTWNRVPLSIQQAYDILIDDKECTLEEYRVYSHLVRNGYRLQRFSYGSETGSVRNDEPLTPKRKVIINPENGLRMTEGQAQQPNSNHVTKPTITENILDNQKRTTNDAIISNEVQNILEGIVTRVENLLSSNSLTTTESNVGNASQPETKKVEEVGVGGRRNGSSNVEIISEERLTGEIKVIKEPIDGATIANLMKHSGSRIQRNVKLLPKRNDKPTSSADVSLSEHGDRNFDKRKATSWNVNTAKKPRNEVIELSDDEIQEVPRALTRMEMLNMIPNIAAQTVITEKISRGYIPHNIKPRQMSYCYKREEIQRIQANDGQLRSNARRGTDNSLTVPTAPHSNLAENIESTHRNMVVSYETIYANYNQPYSYNANSNRYPIGPRFPFNHAAYWQNRSAFVQQNIFQNTLNFVSYSSSDTSIQRNLSIQMNTFFMPHIGNTFVRNQYRQNYYQNVPMHHRYPQHRMPPEKSVFTPLQSSPRAFNPPSQGFRPRYPSRNSPNDPHSPRSQRQYETPNRSTFAKYPGMRSWTDLKKKWREEKTITIDDEDSNREDSVDNSEVQVVEEFINPLVGPKNANSLAEVFEKLRIIKPTPDKTVRRKKGRYKISYNVYSSSCHYRKANPGLPIYRIVIVRKDDSQFLQPIELARLQQDAKGAPIMLANVSMSISFIQPAIVSLPNI